MRTLDAQPLSALELWKPWGGRDNGEWPVLQRGPGNQTLRVYEQPTVKTLWAERPVACQQVSPELAWRVAFEGLVMRVQRGCQPVAFLRPIGWGELDVHRLRCEDLLRCDGPDFPQRRDRALHALSKAQQEKFILCRRQSLLAVLCTYPPLGALSLHELAQQELGLVRRLRTSRLHYEELHRLLDVFDEQQKHLGHGDALDEHQPILRVISHAQDTMLRELREQSIGTRSQLQAVLTAASDESCDTP